MSERAQSLEAALRKLRNECRAIKAMSYDAIKASAGYTNLKCWMDRIDEADALLEAPPVGVSPQPEDWKARDAEWSEGDDQPGSILPASLSPVEPTEVEQDQLKSAAAELWWMGRDSVKDLPTATATGPQLRDRCFVDIQDSRILTPLGKDTTT